MKDNPDLQRKVQLVWSLSETASMSPTTATVANRACYDDGVHSVKGVSTLIKFL
jgi:hypothetical protein